MLFRLLAKPHSADSSNGTIDEAAYTIVSTDIFSDAITNYVRQQRHPLGTSQPSHRSEVHVLEEVLSHLDVGLLLLRRHLLHELGLLANLSVRELLASHHHHGLIPDLLKLVIVLFLLCHSLLSGCGGGRNRRRVVIRFAGVAVGVAVIGRLRGPGGDARSACTRSRRRRAPLLMDEQGAHHFLVFIRLTDSESRDSILGHGRDVFALNTQKQLLIQIWSHSCCCVLNI
ncbi:hypothetical protein EYF80_001069 [Liparis tanakae]|uniref:Uncharacterized protein n=1 Tax=Liparis tanakae TaxID=230148 RepID=A0A4Z2JFI5_9TELE|nr:hypothetical protein EYF80_001069 [Liparis tanakae]